MLDVLVCLKDSGVHDIIYVISRLAFGNGNCFAKNLDNCSTVSLFEETMSYMRNALHCWGARVTLIYLKWLHKNF